MEINSRDYGGFWSSGICVQNRAQAVHAAPSPLARAPIINNSCPCYINPAMESTSHQIPFILGQLPAVHWTVQKAAGFRGGVSHSTAKALLHFLRISSHYQVYGKGLPLTTRV